MRVTTGLRVGFWNPNPPERYKPFRPMGVYVGPDLGDHIPGAKLVQPLMEGELQLRVGVLFRPDLGKHQKLETILIIDKYIPEMFNYEHWESAIG